MPNPATRNLNTGSSCSRDMLGGILQPVRVIAVEERINHGTTAFIAFSVRVIGGEERIAQPLAGGVQASKHSRQPDDVRSRLCQLLAQHCRLSAAPSPGPCRRRRRRRRSTAGRTKLTRTSCDTLHICIPLHFTMHNPTSHVSYVSSSARHSVYACAGPLSASSSLLLYARGCGT